MYTVDILTVFNAGPSQCFTKEVAITITDNQWPWKAAYENSGSIEFKMLESNLTSAVSNVVKCLSSIFNKALVNVQVTRTYNYF